MSKCCFKRMRRSTLWLHSETVRVQTQLSRKPSFLEALGVSILPNQPSCRCQMRAVDSTANTRLFHSLVPYGDVWSSSTFRNLWKQGLVVRRALHSFLVSLMARSRFFD